MKAPVSILLVSLGCFVACGSSSDGDDNSSTGDGDTGNGDGDTGDGDTGDGDTGDGEAAHDFCQDVGETFGAGSSIFGDPGTDWFLSAAKSPNNVNWSYGYAYAAGDPQDDLEGFSWIINYRLDTAEEGGANIPLITFYRMLYVGQDHGYSGGEPLVVQKMLTNPDAVREYLDDLIATLDILGERATPTLLQMEPDSWGFMMWAFEGFDGTLGNGDATAIDVDLSGANHPSLAGQSFSDDAAGLAKAMLYLRDTHAPQVRMGFHASNFRNGTKPEVVTSFYSSLGSWDAIFTEPPHMTHNGTGSWDKSVPSNSDNLSWLSTVSGDTGLPIVIWQTYVEDADAYFGSWPTNKDNMTAFAENGVVGVLWDPNAVDGSCDYGCQKADDLLGYLSAYSASPLQFPSSNPCGK